MITKQYRLRTCFKREKILEMTECYEKDPNFQTYVDILDDIIEEYQEKLTPKGYIVIDGANRCEPIAGAYTVSCLVTLGKEIDEYIQTLFSKYEYLEGMLLNTLVDEVLFDATNHLYTLISDDLKAGAFDTVIQLSPYYMTRRHEPGDSLVSMHNQKILFDVMKLSFPNELEQLVISEGLMFSPTKTVAYYYGLTENDCSQGIDHDCSICLMKECPNRQYNIHVIKGDKTEVIHGSNGENLLQVLRNHNYFVDAPCSGKQLCGKCKVQVRGNTYELSEREAGFLSTTEIERGIVLACFHEIEADITIMMPEDIVHHQITADYKPFMVKMPRILSDKQKGMGVAIDLGTTTVVVALIDLLTGETIGIRRQLNPQKTYGADVISRIMYVNEHDGQHLQEVITKSIELMVVELCLENQCSTVQIGRMVISGNTTMMYLLQNIDPSALAIAPFETHESTLAPIPSKNLFESLSGFEITIMPWISAYVGGDIVAGMYSTDMISNKATILLVDIGTNGEIVLKTPDRILSAATAAGPAFEGANIRCGTGSVPGAICELVWEDNTFKSEVIEGLNHGEEVVGLCGSALIDGIAILLEQGHIENSGFMDKAIELQSSVSIYPEDVRQVQLAKAAIKAGIDVLLQKANITYEEIDKVFIAGGFGKHINIEHSVSIGLLPRALKPKVDVVGNTSLAGALRYLLEAGGEETIERIQKQCEYIELSTSHEFYDAYIMGMTFGEDE